MPLILSQGDEMKWMDPGLKTDHIKELIKPFPETKITAYTISRDANNAKNYSDYPEIMNRINYPELVEEENLLF